VAEPFRDDLLAELLAAARSLNEYVPPERTRSQPAPAPVNGATGDRPGDAFNRSATWEEILEPHGWAKVRQFDRHSYWRRPGKDKGVSATADYCRTEAQGGLLYVFSSSAAPLEMDTGYSRFAAFAVLNHRGDFAAAARALSPAGSFTFGRKVPAAEAVESAGREADDGLALTCLTTIRGKPIRWLVPGYLPRGKTVLWGGDGGHGKSAGSLHVAACLTTARPCFGLRYEPPPPSEVLLISCEDDYSDTVLPRLLAAGADLSKVFRVDGVRAKGRDERPLPFSLAHYEALSQELARRPAVRLVIIDPAGSFVGRAKVDDHKNAELRALLDPLSEKAAQHEVCILIITHLNKAAAVKAVNRISGSNAYVNAVRAAFLLAPDTDDPAGRKLFMPIKFNLGPWPDALAYLPKALPLGEAKVITNLPAFSDLTEEDRERVGRQLFRIDWTGPVDVKADDVMIKGSQAERGPNKVDRCVDWLRTFIGAFAWYDEEILKAAEREGYTEDNVRRAKTLLRNRDSLKSRPIGQAGKWLNGFGDLRLLQRPPATPNTPHIPNTPKSPKTETSETSETSESEEIAERVFSLLSEGDLWSAAEVSERLKLDAARTAESLEQLVGAGRIERRSDFDVPTYAVPRAPL
jgi:hypothetical protein